MEGVAATICVEGFNFERGKMSDGAIGGAGIVATVRSSRNDDGGAPGLREVGTRVHGSSDLLAHRAKSSGKTRWSTKVSQAESGLGASFDVSQDGNTRFRIFFAISVRAGSPHGREA